MAVQSTFSGTQPGGPDRGSAHGQCPAPTGQQYSIDPITTAEGLASLEPEWNRLYESSPSPNVFMSFDWFRAWHQHFTQQGGREQRSLNVLVVKQDGAVTGILPLVRRTASRFGFSVRKMEFVVERSDYNDLVLGNDPSGQSKAIANFLIQTQDQWDLVDLRNLREMGKTSALIEGALSPTELQYRLLPEMGRYLNLRIDAPWSEMVGRLSRTARHTLRKQQRRLDRMGMRVRIVENPHEEPDLLQKLIALESQKIVHAEQLKPFIAAYPDVFQSLFDRLGPRGWFYLALMELYGRPVAWHLGFRCGKGLWAYSTAYDRSFARFSPGTMLVPAILDYGFSHGFTEYDLLRGEEPYKTRWATSFRQTFQLQIWNQRWVSRARAFMYLDLKTAIYRLLGKGP